jgi:hypothetical protein
LLSGVTQKVTHKGDPALLWVTLPWSKAEAGGKKCTPELNPVPAVQHEHLIGRIALSH